jgi:hypothetical protein
MTKSHCTCQPICKHNIATPLITFIYGVVTSMCILVVLAILLRSVVLTDLVGVTSDHTDGFECGYNVADFTSTDILDLRTLISLYILFDTEL